MMKDKAHILIVDDERTNINALGNILIKEYEVSVALSGEQAIEFLEQTANLPDMILLDIIMPELDGYQVCKKIKNSDGLKNIPIIFISALTEASEKVAGFSAGAVDFICKPFSDMEVLARIKTHLSIKEQHSKLLESNNELNGLNEELKTKNLKAESIEEDKLRVDKNSFRLSFNNISIELTSLEFNLFYLLYQKPDRIYSRQQILDLAYPDLRDISDRTVDAHIKNIRKKIKILGITQAVIDSVYGAGYRYIPSL